jgi:hypothetical protein
MGTCGGGGGGGLPRYTQGTSTQTYVAVCGTAGATAVLPDTDDEVAMVPTPFAFRFWGVDIPAGSSVGVSSNGYIEMNASGTNTLSGTIPSVGAPNAVIAPYWADNYTSTSGICLKTLGVAPNRQWVIEWRSAYHCCSMGTVNTTYEVFVNEGSSTIDFVYQTMNGSRTETVGLENQAGTVAVGGCVGGATSCAPTTGQRVRFTPSP